MTYFLHFCKAQYSFNSNYSKFGDYRMVGSDGRASIRWPCDPVPYLGFVLSVLQSAKSTGSMGKRH
jgi:hypothetical protein